MPRGGARKGAGRPRGSKSKPTPERLALRVLAQKHTKIALQTLVHVTRNGQSEGARIQAATALLDRAYGRPTQATELTGTVAGPVASAWDDSSLDKLSAEQLSALYAEKVQGSGGNIH